MVIGIVCAALWLFVMANAVNFMDGANGIAMGSSAILLAALAYFVMPVDFIPDIVAAFGFTDDATVLMAALGLVSSYMKPRHRKAAREALGLPPPKKDED